MSQTCNAGLKESIFCRQLLAWYDKHRRALPWRRDRNPYRVWISEIMLQQTRVAAVIEHYHEFLRRFPTVQKLAAAREASVLAVWSGLGYYRRARMLHEAAKMIVRERDGRFPASSRELQQLPGIGRYTAAAIASIAFNEPVAVVDGNVERVLQRITGERLGGERLWETVNRLLDEKRAGDFNQAMMELGATVCTPRAPMCLTCPVLDSCATRGELAAIDKPIPQKKLEVHYTLTVRNGTGRDKAVFLVRRSQDESLMAGMWELPGVTSEKDGQPLFTVKHSITVTDYTVQVWACRAGESGEGKWMPVARLKQIALTGLARKILRKAEIL